MKTTTTYTTENKKRHLTKEEWETWYQTKNRKMPFETWFKEALNELLIYKEELIETVNADIVIGFEWVQTSLFDGDMVDVTKNITFCIYKNSCNEFYVCEPYTGTIFCGTYNEVKNEIENVILANS